MARITKDQLKQENSNLATRLTAQLNENSSLKVQNEELGNFLIVCYFLWLFVIIAIILVIFNI